MDRNELREIKERENRRIRDYIYAHVEDYPRRLAMRASEHLELPMYQCYREIQRMVSEGLLQGVGKTARRCFHLTEHGERDREARQKKQAAAKKRVPLSDTGLLDRGARTYQEAERVAWLKRKRR